MKTLDCLFLHPTTHVKTPKLESSDSLAFVIMPAGTIANADLLERAGFDTKIIHSGVEQICDRNFSIENVFKKYDASVVGIDLHWYVHAYDAIRIANIVKRVSNAFVVLGGFTASFFAEEILSRFNCIDAVIHGDAEVPLLELLKHKSRTKFEEVPNLVYRSDNKLKYSKRRYVANTSDLDQLNYSNLSLLENSDRYVKLIHECGDLIPPKVTLKMQGWICMGRGCSVNCSYCGGGQKADQILTGRNAPIFRSQQKTIETLTRLEEMKISSILIDFDPYPTNRKYYKDLFAMIRKEKIDISSQFSLWSLSDKDFLEDFRRTFNPLYSTISLQIDSGSEYIRRLNKGFYYTNEDLFYWLNNVKHEMIPIELLFTSGNSWETEKHFQDTIQLGRKIIEEYPMVVTLFCNPLILDPGCPRYLKPKKYGIIPRFKGFIDYYDTYKCIAEGLPAKSQLGYETNHLSESQIIQLSQQFNQIISLAYFKKWEKLLPT